MSKSFRIVESYVLMLGIYVEFAEPLSESGWCMQFETSRTYCQGECFAIDAVELVQSDWDRCIVLRGTMW